MVIKSKGKGKSGGARVITFNILTDANNGQVVLLLYIRQRKRINRQSRRDKAIGARYGLLGIKDE